MSLVMKREFQRDLTPMQRLVAVILDVETIWQIQKLEERYGAKITDSLTQMAETGETRVHAEVLRMRYGLDEADGRGKTLEEIGRLRNDVTKERIRQIEASAIKRLRAMVQPTIRNQVRTITETAS